MWKVLLLVAFAASLAFVSCDNSSNDDKSGSGCKVVDAVSSASTDASNTQTDNNSGDDNISYKCRANEVFSNCTNGGCDARNCSQAGKPVPCVKLNPKSCIKGCVCQSGYLRASNGTCVLRNQCNEGCGDDPNAHPGCGVNCGKTCETYKIKNPFCILICNENGCDCNDGYVFDSAVKKCVLPKKCTPTCGLNEQYDGCINGGCGHRNCSQLGQPQVCVDVAEGACIKGCRCVDGYLRASNGTCVLQDQCPGCGGDPNAMPGCGYNCGTTCESYKVKNPICPRIQCTPDKCDCKPGFVFDSNIQKCVLPKDCTKCDKPNEVYDKCPAPCPPRRCDVNEAVIKCKAPPKPGDPECSPGCRCADNYYRNATGTCVLKKQCEKPLKCNSPNEVYNACPAICPPQECGVGIIFCPRNPVYGDPNCRPSCICIDGYVRNDAKKCIPKDKCPPTCGLNEQYDSCINGGCGHRNCSQLGQPQLCVDVVEGACIKGCRCVDGYLRASNGTCVLQDQCPGCGGDPNAMPGCGYNCGKTCETYKVKNPLCPRIQCTPDKCDCKPGFVLDSNIKKCVLPKDCTPSSDECPGQNEFFDTCISGCSNQTCDTIGKVFHCPIQPAVCRTGCRCNPGFYRNADNVCVAESECPTPDCPEGEIYSRCPTVKCDGDYCPKTRNSPLTCPVGIVCDPPRCVCGFNRHRDRKTGKCIATADCPPFKCDGPNEEYQSCPATCPGENCTDYIYSTKCPPYRIGIVVPCIPKCKCKQGYYRNSDGTCIPGPQCGPKMNSTAPVQLKPITTTNTPPTTGSDNNNDNNNDDSLNNSSDAKTGVASLQAGITQFTGKFLYDRMKVNSGENIIASPFSVFTPLAQLALYADGDCLKQLTSVLNIASKQDIRAAFPALAASYDGQTSVNFSTAAKVYSNKDFPLSDGFKKDSVDVIHAEAQELNFNAPAQAADIINKYVESKTNNRIKDLIQSSDLNALTRLVLINAIYFKGDWLYSFNTNDTKDADFYLSDGTTKKTKLMYQQGQFNYGEVPELDCEVLEMFYTGKNFSMVIVLPNAKDGIMKTAESLQDSANFNKVLGSMRSQKVKVYLPSFEISTTTDLADILKQEGVTKIFDQKDSGLSGLLQKPEDTYVSKAIQKAFILVNEAGSEAAAANGIVGARPATPGLPPPPPIVFRADHAFLYYIRVQATTMFCGAYIQ